MELETYSGLSPTESSCCFHIQAIPDIVTVTESTAQTDGVWYAILDVANTTFAVPLTSEDQDQFAYVFSTLPEVTTHLPLASSGWVRI